MEGISAAGITEKLLYRELLITMEYSHPGMVKNEVEQFGGRQMDLNYGEKVEMKIFLRHYDLEGFWKKGTFHGVPFCGHTG